MTSQLPTIVQTSWTQDAVKLVNLRHTSTSCCPKRAPQQVVVGLGLDQLLLLVLIARYRAATLISLLVGTLRIFRALFLWPWPFSPPPAWSSWPPGAWRGGGEVPILDLWPSLREAALSAFVLEALGVGTLADTFAGKLILVMLQGVKMLLKMSSLHFGLGGCQSGLEILPGLLHLLCH